MIFALKLRWKFGDFPASHDSGLEGHHVSWSIFHVFPIMNPSHFSWFNQFTTILGGWQAYLHPVFVGSTSILDWPRFHQISQLNPTTPLSHVCLKSTARSCLAAPVPRVASWPLWQSAATRSAAHRSAFRWSQRRSRARRWCRCRHPCDWERWLVWRCCPS